MYVPGTRFLDDVAKVNKDVLLHCKVGNALKLGHSYFALMTATPSRGLMAATVRGNLTEMG